MTPFLKTRNNHRAFSLPELLIAVLVVGFLSVLVFPSLAQAQRRSRGTHCQTNCGKIGQAFLVYSKSHDGEVVPHTGRAKELSKTVTKAATQPATWFDLICETAGERRGPAGCPEAARSDANNSLGIGYTQLTRDTLSKSPRKISDIKHPARTVLFGDTAMVANSALEPDQWQAKSSSGGCGAPYFSIPKSPDWQTDPWRMVNRHENRANAVFADGHVESIPVSRVGFQFLETDVRAHWDTH